jgi:hypothetical protein
MPDVRYGLSTGWNAALRGDFAAGTRVALGFSAGVVELGAHTLEDLTVLEDYIASPASQAELQRFDEVSVHGPTAPPGLDWTNVSERLAQLPRLIARVVLHPDVLAEPGELLPVGPRAVVENMDVTKLDGRTAAELERTFAGLPEAGLCLDVAHAWTVDPSMEEGSRILDRWGDRLAELHVSGIDLDGVHRSPTRADLATYEPLLTRCRHVPWVFEMPPTGG